MNRFAELPDLKIRRTGTVDQVAQHLRAMIADGRLTQGERLPEIPLSEVFGVSRNTLRDAMRLLAGEGLVQHELHRGAVVRALSPDDVSDIYGVRRMLEMRALEIAPRAPRELRARVHEALAACGDALAQSDYSGFVEHELEFHGALVGLLGSERFDRFFANVLGELRLLFSELSADSEPKASRAILALYRRIFRAAEKGDHATASKLLGAHLDTYESRLRATLEQPASEAVPSAG